MDVGIIGLGKMGMAVSRRLVAEGHRVLGWDIDPALAADLVAAGGEFGASPADVAARSEAVLSLVTDDAAARWLFDHAGGLLADQVSGKIFVELSTLQPATVIAIGTRVAEAGAAFVGAPVVGSIPTVAEGKLLILAGGTTGDVERAEAVLRPIARRVVHLGPLGAGNAMKLVVNLTMASYLGALAEGLALGCEHGLILGQMLELLTEAPTANPWLSNKLGILAGGTGATTLDIASMRKDVLSAVAAGSASGVAMPMTTGILASLSTAVSTGHGREDIAQLPGIFRQTMVRRPGATGTGSPTAS